MSRLPWFRMYTESRNDSKLEALSDREFRIWHKLLCLSAEDEPRGVVDYGDPEFVGMELRVGHDELDLAITRFIKLRLLARDDTFIYFPAFSERQYTKPSDHPDRIKERVQRHRNNKKRGETRYVTPTDTESDSEHKDLCDRGPVDNFGPHHVADVLPSLRDLESGGR
jgi:hypothetical protein